MKQPVPVYLSMEEKRLVSHKKDIVDMVMVLLVSFKMLYEEESEIIFQYGPRRRYFTTHEDIKLKQETYQMPDLYYEFSVYLDPRHQNNS